MPFHTNSIPIILQVGNGEFEVIRQQGFASNKVEIRINSAF